MKITIQLFLKKQTKSISLFLVIIGLLISANKGLAQTTLNFDDLSGDTYTSLGTYKDFNWSSQMYSITYNYLSGTGYEYGTTSKPISIFNGYASWPIEIKYSKSSSICFNSFYLTAAWDNGQVVDIYGLSGSTVVYTKQVTLSTTSPLFVKLDWCEIDKITLNSSGAHVVIDDFTVNPCSDTAISSITSTPNNNTYTGGVNTNLYIGYPNNSPSTTLSAVGSSNVTWSPSTNLSCSTCVSPVFTPTAAGNYTLTATNCAGSKTINICVKDIRVPNTSGTKAAVYMCHLEPGKTTPQTLAVVLRGIPGHFTYHKGDKLGVCGNTCTSNKRDFEVADLVIDEQYLEVMCTPNPFRNSFKLNYVSHLDMDATISIYGMTGNLMETTTLNGVANEAELGNNLPNGIYTVSFNQGDTKKVFRMIKID